MTDTTEPVPDRDRGEYLDERGKVKVCRACKKNATVRRHTCGLSYLQDLLGPLS